MENRKNTLAFVLAMTFASFAAFAADVYSVTMTLQVQGVYGILRNPHVRRKSLGLTSVQCSAQLNQEGVEG